MRRSRLWLTVVAPVILVCGVRRGRKGGAGRALGNGARTFESACALVSRRRGQRAATAAHRSSTIAGCGR